MTPARDVDAYLAGVPADQRAALETLRAQFKAAAPGVTETISYGVPVFKLGKSLVSMGAAKAHCAFYVMSSTAIEAFSGELSGYSTSAGTIRFKPDAPLPPGLVARIVAARIAENAAAAARAR